MLTLNSIEDTCHQVMRADAPGERPQLVVTIGADLATATRIVALLNLAAWVEAGTGWRTVTIEREDAAMVYLDGYDCAGADAPYGSGATLDEALADLGVLR